MLAAYSALFTAGLLDLCDRPDYVRARSLTPNAATRRSVEIASRRSSMPVTVSTGSSGTRSRKDPSHLRSFLSLDVAESSRTRDDTSEYFAPALPKVDRSRITTSFITTPSPTAPSPPSRSASLRSNNNQRSLPQPKPAPISPPPPSPSIPKLAPPDTNEHSNSTSSPSHSVLRLPSPIPMHKSPSPNHSLRTLDISPSSITFSPNDLDLDFTPDFAPPFEYPTFRSMRMSDLFMPLTAHTQTHFSLEDPTTTNVPHSAPSSPNRPTHSTKPATCVRTASGRSGNTVGSSYRRSKRADALERLQGRHYKSFIGLGDDDEEESVVVVHHKKKRRRRKDLVVTIQDPPTVSYDAVPHSTTPLYPPQLSLPHFDLGSLALSLDLPPLGDVDIPRMDSCDCDDWLDLKDDVSRPGTGMGIGVQG